MNFNDFKNKMRRKFRNFSIGGIGAAVCSAKLLIELYGFAIQLFLIGIDGDFSSIIFLVINCVFDLYLVRYFITSKENNSLAPARLAIIFLIIANYVLPALQMIVGSIFTSSTGAALLSVVISGTVLGIVYFIMLILEYRKRRKHSYLIMAIVGGLMLLISIAQGALLIVSGVEVLTASSDLLYGVLYLIYYLLNAFVTIGMSLIFFLYPLLALREQKRGY